MIASRTVSKCDALKAELEGKFPTRITTAQVDADNVEELTALIKSYAPDVGPQCGPALPGPDDYGRLPGRRRGLRGHRQLRARGHRRFLPGAKSSEKRCKDLGFSAYFDYSWQWAYKEKFEKAGLTALLGTGFDPGVTQRLLGLRPEALLRRDRTPSIFSTAMAATTGYPFATNFNPEINLREGQRPRQLLGERPLGGNSCHEHQAGV